MFAVNSLTRQVINCAEKNCLAAKAQMALGIIKGKPVSGVVGGGETPIEERKGSDVGTQKETALGRGKGGNSSKRGRAIMFAAARKSNKNAKVPTGNSNPEGYNQYTGKRKFAVVQKKYRMYPKFEMLSEGPIADFDNEDEANRHAMGMTYRAGETHSVSSVRKRKAD